jgi:hypothetical protein
MVEAVKDPRKVKAGQIGSRARWGERRIVRLDTLDSDTARLIRALLAQTKTTPAVSETSAGVDAEGHVRVHPTD